MKHDKLHTYGLADALYATQCANNLVREPARPDADSVREQRMGRLCARWRAESERLWKAANGYPEEKDRIRADTLDSVADELELLLGTAGAEPTKEIAEE